MYILFSLLLSGTAQQSTGNTPATESTLLITILLAAIPACIAAIVSVADLIWTRKSTKKLAHMETTRPVDETMMDLIVLFEDTFTKKKIDGKNCYSLLRDKSEEKAKRKEFNDKTMSVKIIRNKIRLHHSSTIVKKYDNFLNAFEPFYKDTYLNFSIPDEVVIQGVISINQIASDIAKKLHQHQG